MNFAISLKLKLNFLLHFTPKLMAKLGLWVGALTSKYILYKLLLRQLVKNITYNRLYAVYTPP